MSSTPDAPTIEAGTLAPSEVVLLRADAFIGRPGLIDDDFGLPGGHAKVSAGQLARTTLCVALLAAEAAGTIELEEQRGRQGLVPTTFVYAKPGPHPSSWPMGSLEAKIGAGVRAKPVKVQDLVVALLHTSKSNPERQVLAVIEEGLAGRQLLTAEKTRHLLVFSSTRYHATEQATGLAAEQPLGPIQGLLEACRSSRPELWKHLTDQIKTGIQLRSAQTDTD